MASDAPAVEREIIPLTEEGEPLKPSDYVHLHNHTQYSLLDGLTKLPALFNFVNEKGMQAVAFVLNFCFVILFAGSALLFRRAGTQLGKERMPTEA